MASGPSVRPRDGNRRHVVMVGDVRVGKSTLIERLTDHKRLSSSSARSFTKTAEVFVVPDRSLSICDTPGTNPLKERIQHNIWIAAAFSQRPVNLLLIVVKADLGVANVVQDVVRYAEGFLQFHEVLGVCVTHMDTVSWSEAELRASLDDHCGITNVVCSGLRTTARNLQDALVRAATRPAMNVDIDSQNFLQYFRINDSNLRILGSVRKEVQRFEAIKQQFYQNYDGNLDMAFEFQTWLNEEIERTQRRLTEQHQFQLFGPTLANEAGHIANLTHQLKSILQDVRTKCMERVPNHSSPLRKCPHCGEVWVRISGCDDVCCGAPKEDALGKTDQTGVGSFNTYNISWDEANQRLSIVQRGRKQVQQFRTWGKWRGCGRALDWNAMQPVELPAEVPAISVDDVSMLQRQAMPQWTSFFDSLFAQCTINERN